MDNPRAGTGWVPALKGNRPRLRGAGAETFAVEQAEGFEGCDHDFHKPTNKNHVRMETRRCRVVGIPEYIRYVDPDESWPDLHSLVMIAVQRRQGTKVTARTRYCTCPPNARILLQAVRSHWGIENSLHRVLWPSGRTRVASAPATPPATLSILRRMVLNQLCRETTAKRKLAGTTGTCSRSCHIGMRLPCANPERQPPVKWPMPEFRGQAANDPELWSPSMYIVVADP